MDVSTITGSTGQGYTPYAPTAGAAENTANTNGLFGEAAVYEKSGAGSYKVDEKAVKAAIDEMNASLNHFQLLAEKVFGKQMDFSFKAGNVTWTKEFWENLEVDEETRLRAQQEIGEDGYFGVKQTSERLINFAKAISGGDPSKIGLLREAVQAGFDEAEKMWGGKLPEISYQTLEATMKGFDEWAASAGLTPAEK